MRDMITDDRSWLARGEAAIACGLLKDEKSMASTRKILASDPADKTQLAAMDALGLFGEAAETAVPLIANQLESGQWQLRVGACQALGQLGSMTVVDAL